MQKQNGEPHNRKASAANVCEQPDDDDDDE